LNDDFCGSKSIPWAIENFTAVEILLHASFVTVIWSQMGRDGPAQLLSRNHSASFASICLPPSKPEIIYSSIRFPLVHSLQGELYLNITEASADPSLATLSQQALAPFPSHGNLGRARLRMRSTDLSGPLQQNSRSHSDIYSGSRPIIFAGTESFLSTRRMSIRAICLHLPASAVL
jgi:hypothetical protein